MANTWRYVLAHRKWFLKTASLHRRVGNPLITVLVPMVGETHERHGHYFENLQKLLTQYLARQTYRHYEVIIYCDGPNRKAREWIEQLQDNRIHYAHLEMPTGKWGHPQTRASAQIAAGEYFVRMNCDNRPYPDYLENLLDGFRENGADIVYGRVVYKGEALRSHGQIFWGSPNKPFTYKGIFNELFGYILPRDRSGSLRHSNIDCMNYMFRTCLLKNNIKIWMDDYDADWKFIEFCLSHGGKARFLDVLLGEKW